MTETLERALAPLMTIGGFCNLGMFEYPLGQPRTYISCLYGLAKWGLLIYFWYYPHCINSFQKDKIIHIINIIPFLTIMLILISICRFKELKMCLRELAIVDHTLEALGTPKEYQMLRNWIIRLIIGWIVYIFFQLVYIYFVFSFINYNIGFTVFVYWMHNTFLNIYPSTVIILSALISATILGLVLYRVGKVTLQVIYKLLFIMEIEYK
ncbi:hypothetical protein ALC57_04984 [Trachymyrmex cornetzi]|uniref:Gustatory receptor n=1 Tax=Trachymyrmex cornetzi TaxID=471704 RepID=A0A151JCA5_9HYME|nr:hypothetical protein ALC57_04984 [Trachymyrmex cornetzi]